VPPYINKMSVNLLKKRKVHQKVSWM